MNTQVMRFLVIGVLVLGLVGVANNAVYGEAPPSEAQSIDAILERLMAAPDPHAAFRDLPPDEQGQVIDALTPVRYETGVVTDEGLLPDLMAYDHQDEACKPNIYHRTAYGPTGIKVWRYISDTEFCYDGHELTTDPTFGTRGETFLFWEFVGDVSTSESGGAGDWMHSDYASGHFRLCIHVIGIGHTCIVNNYPWIRKRSYGSGAIFGTGGG